MVSQRKRAQFIVSSFTDFTSVKISNNALNFLLAQYRAIFKRAYVKGIASAVLLTAGLAAGQAQAAGSLSLPNQLPGQDVEYIVDGSGSTDNTFDKVNINTSGSGSFNGTLTIENGSVEQNFFAGSGDALNITGQGTLNIAVEGDDVTNSGMKIVGNTGNVDVDINAVNVTRGTLMLSDTNSGNSGTAALKADVITIGSEGATDAEAYLTISSLSNDVGATLGRADDKNRPDSQISVLGGGVLTMQGSGSSGATIQGASLRLATGAVMLTDTGDKNFVETDNFTVENGAFKVISGSGTDEVKETFQGHTATVQSGGNFLVGQSGTWTISDTAETDPDNNNKAITTQVTFEAGSNVQVAGNIVVSGGSGGLLTIESGANLHALISPDSANNKLAGTISLSVGKTTQGTGLAIDSKVLDDFLTSGDTYNAITPDAETNGYTLAESGFSDKAGSVVLKRSRLAFLDQDRVELSQFGFVSGDGTSGSAGQIVVSGTVAAKSHSVISGHDISVAKKLTSSGDGEGTVLTGADVYVSADILTLGENSTDAANALYQLSGSGLGKIKATQGLNVNVADSVNGGFFTMNAGVETVELINSNPDLTAQVNGNIEFTSSQRTPVKGKWVFNDDVKLTGTGDANNSLNIGPWNGSGDSTKVDTITYDTHVAFEGQIINNAANGHYVGILAQTNGLEGVETTVDFTQAKLSSANGANSGMLSLQAYDSAVMKFAGNQFSQILSTDNTASDYADGFQLVAGRSGTIEITTPVTGDYSFGKFAAKTESNKNSENVMLFDGAGVLDINGDLGLYTGDKEKPETAGNPLDIGSGTIKANQISLTNYHVTDEKKGTHEAVTLQSGTLEVSQGLTVKLSDTLNVGSGSTDVASIVLESDTLTGTGTLAVSKDVNLNGNGSIEVHQGAWSTTANIYAKGSSGLVLANDKVNADDLAEGTYAASFVGKNFKAEGTGTAISAGAGTKALRPPSTLCSWLMTQSLI